MPAQVAVGTIIFYCAGIGQQAKDFLPGDGDAERNGVCTRFLLKVLGTDPVSFEAAANDVQLLVHQATSPFFTPAQTPAIYDQMIGSYVLKQPDPEPVAIAARATRDVAFEIAARDVAASPYDAFTSSSVRGMRQAINNGLADVAAVPPPPEAAQAPLSGTSVGIFFEPSPFGGSPRDRPEPATAGGFGQPGSDRNRPRHQQRGGQRPGTNSYLAPRSAHPE